MDEPAIRARSLTKHYGAVKAVDGLDLEVRRGEIYGFLGRNGAGKTTTIRMLLGLVRPTSGSLTLLGRSLTGDRGAILARTGSFVESASAYPNLTVRENLSLHRRLTGAPREAVDRVIAQLSLGEYADRRADRLSLGNRQRLSLARALVASPELLILDEPANGLDPAGIAEIRNLLRSLADDHGVTVFLSSHQLDEIRQLADRIGIVHRGRLVEEGDYHDLRNQGRWALEVQVDNGTRAEALLRDELGLSGITRSDGVLRITDPAARPAEVARALVGAGLALERLVPLEEDLERHFLALTEEQR